jgi:putative glutamine amidotransferase
VVEDLSLNMRRDAPRPRILVTIRRAPDGADAATVTRVAESARFYANAVAMAGGDPVLVRAGDPMPDAYDGVLFSGGADVHPGHYGQEINDRVRLTLMIDNARDTMELPLARRALSQDLPVLCICRGVQLLNVAAGGSLWQDLSLAGVEPPAHNQDGRLNYWEYGHDVAIEPGSRLAALMGTGAVGANTYHHQAIAEPADGFRITARAADGTPEGLESPAHRFVVGVQWHPERLVEHHIIHRRLFEGLVEASRRA